MYLPNFRLAHPRPESDAQPPMTTPTVAAKIVANDVTIVVIMSVVLAVLHKDVSAKAAIGAKDTTTPIAEMIFFFIDSHSLILKNSGVDIQYQTHGFRPISLHALPLR